MQLSMDEMNLSKVRLRWMAATRERCLTVTPRCASPSTPSPVRTRIAGWFGLRIVWVPLLLTAVTTPLIGQTPPLSQSPDATL